MVMMMMMMIRRAIVVDDEKSIAAKRKRRSTASTTAKNHPRLASVDTDWILPMRKVVSCHLFVFLKFLFKLIFELSSDSKHPLGDDDAVR